MQSVTVVPGTKGTARLEAVVDPALGLGSVVVDALAVGICGTDVEIAAGDDGWAPPGEERLVLGHESLGRVVDPGPTGLSVGDHVVGIVRRPDPVPCPNCSVGEWDMCSNGQYTEQHQGAPAPFSAPAVGRSSPQRTVQAGCVGEIRCDHVVAVPIGRRVHE